MPDMVFPGSSEASRKNRGGRPLWQPLAWRGRGNRCAERSALRRPQHGKAIEHTVEAVDRGLVGCAQFAVAGCATQLLEPLQHGLDLGLFVRRRRCERSAGRLGRASTAAWHVIRAPAAGSAALPG